MTTRRDCAHRAPHRGPGRERVAEASVFAQPSAIRIRASFGETSSASPDLAFRRSTPSIGGKDLLHDPAHQASVVGFAKGFGGSIADLRDIQAGSRSRQPLVKAPDPAPST